VTDGSNRSDAGAVNVLYGNSSGLTDTDQIWTQASQPTYGIGSAQTNAWFGFALAAGDLGNGSRTDLVIGAPGRNVNSVTDSGMVQVLNGTATGLDVGGNTWWHQDQPSIADQLEANDQFGRVIT
jgi:FG-GAP repeat